MVFTKLSEKNLFPALQSLSGLEFKLWALLRARDPFGNGLHINLNEIAATLRCARDSARKALNRLEDDGWLLGEIYRTRAYQRKAKFFEEKRHTNAGNADTNAASADSGAGVTDSGAANADSGAGVTDTNAGDTDTNAGFSTGSTANGDFQEPQKKRSKEKRSLSNIEALDLFLDNLDPSERERFLNFCKDKAAALPSPPSLIRSWIAANSAALWEAYREASQGDSQDRRPDRVGGGGLQTSTAAPNNSAAASDRAASNSNRAASSSNRQKIERELSDRELSDCDREKILSRAAYDRDLCSEDREWAHQSWLELRRKQILANYPKASSA